MTDRKVDYKAATGDRVVVAPHGYVGTVRFVGPIPAIKRHPGSTWVGVELDRPEGKHNGNVRGVRYFDCPDQHGIIVPLHKVTRARRDPKALAGGGMGRRKIRSKSSMEFSADTLALNTAHVDLFPAALDYENFNFLRILVEEDGVPVTGTDRSGNTVLHAVAAKGGGARCVQVLQFLMDHGLRQFLHSRNIFGETAVMAAAHNHKWEAMKYLITEGGDTISKGTSSDHINSVWDSCLNRAAGMQALAEGLAIQKDRRARGELEVPHMRHKESTLRQALFKAASAGDLPYVRMLLEERAVDVNTADKQGSTVLHWIASDAKRLPILKYCVAMGADINIINRIGDTPGLVAARSRQWLNMKHLVTMGASISLKDEKNGKSIFKYAQANLTSRKALTDALAEKRSAREEAAAAAGEAPPPPADDEEEDFEDLESVMDPEPEEKEDPAQFESQEAVQADIQAAAEAQAAQAPTEPSDGEIITAGTFSASITGKKKNKSKAKYCKVTVTENSIRVSYSKGSWYNRKDLEEEYPWSDNMSIQKLHHDSLLVELDPSNNVTLTLCPCPADMLEEFVWKHIWKSVFEGSLAEAKELLTDYEQLCQETVSRIETKLAERTRVGVRKQEVRLQDSKHAEVDRLAQKERAIAEELADLVERFTSIRNQGETLLETFSKMHEALERRMATESQRRQQFLDQEQFSKAQEIKADQDRIEEQMADVGSHKDRVVKLYEDMKTKELNYAYLGHEYE